MWAWSLAARTIWNRQAASELEQLVRDERADIVHFHNTLPLISPAAYYAARRGGAAVVQTLHNYRFVCPKATLFRDGMPCESCVGKMVAWPAVRHACYRESRPATAAIAAMLTFHRVLGTYRKVVDAYIALSQFSCRKLVAAGLPAEKTYLRPNFMMTDPGPGPGDGDYALYLGRLSPEKGVVTLLNAWLGHEPGIPLVICGNGPLASLVAEATARCDRIAWYPDRSDEEVLQRIGSAALFILPSVNYEGFPRTIVEAYAKGTPVVASRLGAMAELVQEGVSGACFEPGNAADLARTIRQISRNPDGLAYMRKSARQLYETRYSASAAYCSLLEIYSNALRARRGPNVDTVPSRITEVSEAHQIDGPLGSPQHDNAREACTL
jgi:glycosyltransferase involved in cell wall biosynthesis